MSDMVFKTKNGINYIVDTDLNLNEAYFDFFSKEWSDNSIFTEDISIMFYPVISEAVSKIQKEKGQREMHKLYSQPLYKLREYLLKKWDKPKTKEEYIQKNLEFKRYQDIINSIEKEYPSEEQARNIIKQVLGKESDLKSYNAAMIGTQINEKTKMPYLLISPRISNYLNGFIFNEKIDTIKLFKFAILHEYGHCFEYLKDLVEKGTAELVNTRLEQDRNKVIDSEGKANAYALKNSYRKDRRELLNNKKENVFDKNQKEYIDGTKNILIIKNGVVNEVC